MSWLDRLRGGFAKTSEKLVDNLAGLFTAEPLSEQALDEIELYGELVIAASASEQPLSPAEIDRVLGLRRAGAERDARNLLPPA